MAPAGGESASAAHARPAQEVAALHVGVFVAALVAPVAVKIAWAVEVTVGANDSTPVIGLPLWLGRDLLAAAAMMILGRALARWLAGAPRVAALTVGLGVWNALHALGYMSFVLTGAGMTWQRLRGDEGATLLDLDLVWPPHLWLGAGLLVAGAALFPLVWLVVRSLPVVGELRVVGPLGGWRALAVAGLLGALLAPAGALLPVYSFDLEETPSFLLLRTALSADAAPGLDPVHLDDAEWTQLLRAENVGPIEPPVTGELSVDNAVIFLAEGIPQRFTSFGAGGFDSTPNLARRAKTEGVRFDHFWSAYHSSIQALFALACATYPPMEYSRRGAVTTRKPRADCGEMSELLAEQDIAVGFFHGGQFGYYDKLSFFGGRGYSVLEDAEVLKARAGRAWSNKWGIDDRVVVDAALSWIDSLPEGQRYVALIVPITAHYPWEFPKDVPARFEGETPQARFSSAVHFLDGALERLLLGLEARDKYDETLVAWLADHGEWVEPLPHKTRGHRNIYEQSLRVPLVLLNPLLFGRAKAEPLVSSRPGSIIDVVPTVLDGLGLSAHPQHLGQSLLRDAWEPRRIFFGAHTARRAFVGFVDGDEKIAVRVRERMPERYDLRADPLEANDLTHEDVDRTARLAEASLLLLRAAEGRLQAMPDLEDTAQVQRAAFDGADVWVERDGEREPCTSVADGGHLCKSAEGPLRVVERERDVRRGRRGPARCLEVELPDAPARVHVAVTDARLLRRVSAVRVGRPIDLPRTGSIEVEVHVDGQRRHRRSVDAKTKPKWMPVPIPQSSLEVSFRRGPGKGETSEAGEGPACLLLTDAAWNE